MKTSMLVLQSESLGVKEEWQARAFPNTAPHGHSGVHRLVLRPTVRNKTASFKATVHHWTRFCEMSMCRKSTGTKMPQKQSFLIYIYMCAYVCEHVDHDACIEVRGQHVGSWLSATTVWDPGTELRSPRSATNSVTHWAILPAFS